VNDEIVSELRTVRHYLPQCTLIHNSKLSFKSIKNHIFKNFSKGLLALDVAQIRIDTLYNILKVFRYNNWVKYIQCFTKNKINFDYYFKVV